MDAAAELNAAGERQARLQAEIDAIQKELKDRAKARKKSSGSSLPIAALLRGQLTAELTTRSQEALRAQLDLEKERRHQAELVAAGCKAEVAELRRSLADAAVREERLHGEVRMLMHLHNVAPTNGSAKPPPQANDGVMVPETPTWPAETVEPQPDANPASQVQAATPAESKPSSGRLASAPDEASLRFAAFVSHAKKDAAMEARYLQKELETALHAPVFLDSDNLRDLRDVPKFVKESKAVVLLQSRHVLERPWCVIELLTAIDAGVPIVGLAMCSCGPASYEFENAAEFLKNFDTRILEANPEAVDALREFGVVDLAEVAWKLSSTIPKIISMPFNPSASRNVLAAVRHDACENIKHAHHVQLPPWSEVREKWLADRSVCTMKAGMNGSSKGGADATAQVATPVGVAVVQAAKVLPVLVALGPLMLALVQQLELGEERGEERGEEAKRLALCVGVLEQDLLAASNLSTRPELVHAIAGLLQQALAATVAGHGAAGTPNGADEDRMKAEDWRRLRAALGRCAEQLEGTGQMCWAFKAPADDERWPALCVQLAEARMEGEASLQHRQLRQRRCDIVASQARQIAALPSIAEGLSPMQFSSRFPMPPGEAERLEALHESRLMDAPLPLPEAETVAALATAAPGLGPHLVNVQITVLDLTMSRGLASHCRSEEGTWYDTQSAGGSVLTCFPRKFSQCQYVVATGETFCRGSADPDAETQFSLHKGLGMEAVMKLVALEQSPSDLGTADAAAEDPMPTLFPAEGDAPPTVRAQGFGRLLTPFTVATYIGTPLWYRGRVLGTMCAWFQDEFIPKEDQDERRRILAELASVFSNKIDAIADRVRRSEAEGAAEAPSPPAVAPAVVARSLHELSGTTLAGSRLDLASLSGKMVVVANVASRCGLGPPTFKRLAAWHAEHAQKLELVLYPSSEFGNQELPAEEIAPFITSMGLPTNGGGCHVMSQVEINGDEADPVWRFLTQAFPGGVWWNFGGIFLVDAAGAVVGRYRAPSQLDALGEKMHQLLAPPSSHVSIE